ncbi:MAG: type IV toxin-antitoxin system AbiEi family antitoxin [Bacteroidetes bacterium]|nr:type IV toxin-antitoxin system AbiEi family antitoxin [Bacteroidota bacterium]
MNTENQSKINQLLSSQPTGTIMLAFWLKEQGYSLELQKRYKKSRWLEAVGTGALKRANDKVNYEGAIYALQKQSAMTIHPGGRTALSLLGLGHFIDFSSSKVVLFGSKNENLPTWFNKYDWGTKVNYYKTAFLPADKFLQEREFKNFSIKISNAPRAIMECLYLVPVKQDLTECYHFMESMNNVRPEVVQELLEICQSVKVKRLFLYLAEKVSHNWFKKLEIEKIDLGKGKRSIILNGCYNSKYKITVPKELELKG